MANSCKTEILGYRTDADLSSSPYRFVLKDGDDDLSVATASAADVVGVTTNNVADYSTTAGTVEVQIGPEYLVTVGATLSQGAELVPGTGGKAVAASAGEIVVAVLLEGGADGEVCRAKAVNYQKNP
jgi:hypothetical protein